jgi:N utilization substance protein A
VVVPDDQLSLAIGRRGQNVRLASQLTNSQIDILTEADASEKRQREFVERSEMFQTELDVDETLAQLLVAEGFTSLEEVAYVQIDEIASIEGLDDEIAGELQSRAAEALERREAAAREERRKLGVEDALAELPYVTEAMLVTLGKANIRTLDDLADLATDELIQRKRVEPRRRAETANKRTEEKAGVLADFALTEEQGNEIIMAARAHWFEDDAAASGSDAEPATGEDAVADKDQ